jgi:hypothetical protein
LTCGLASDPSSLIINDSSLRDPSFSVPSIRDPGSVVVRPPGPVVDPTAPLGGQPVIDPTAPLRPSAGGDPHITTWSGDHFDFQGECRSVSSACVAPQRTLRRWS